MSEKTYAILPSAHITKEEAAKFTVFPDAPFIYVLSEQTVTDARGVEVTQVLESIIMVVLEAETWSDEHQKIYEKALAEHNKAAKQSHKLEVNLKGGEEFAAALVAEKGPKIKGEK